MLDEEEANRELQARLLGTSDNANGKLLFPNQAERYRWSQVALSRAAPELRDFVRDEVFPYMASLVKDEPQIAEYFRDAVLEIVDPNVLKQVIDELDGIDFRKLGPDVKGDIFEYLLTHLGQSALNGQFRTPRQIRTMMVEMVDPILATLSMTRLWHRRFSHRCRGIHSGQVFVRTTEKCRSTAKNGWSSATRRSKKPRRQSRRCRPTAREPEKSSRIGSLLESSIYGLDVSRQMMRIAMMNLVLHGIRHAGVKRANALSELGGLDRGRSAPHATR